MHGLPGLVLLLLLQLLLPLLLLVQGRLQLQLWQGAAAREGPMCSILGHVHLSISQTGANLNNLHVWYWHTRRGSLQTPPRYRQRMLVHGTGGYVQRHLHVREGLLVLVLQLLQAGGATGVGALGAVRGGERGRAAAPGRSRLGRHAACARPQAPI